MKKLLLVTVLLLSTVSANASFCTAKNFKIASRNQSKRVASLNKKIDYYNDLVKYVNAKELYMQQYSLEEMADLWAADPHSTAMAGTYQRIMMEEVKTNINNFKKNLSSIKKGFKKIRVQWKKIGSDCYYDEDSDYKKADRARARAKKAIDKIDRIIKKVDRMLRMYAEEEQFLTESYELYKDSSCAQP